MYPILETIGDSELKLSLDTQRDTVQFVKPAVTSSTKAAKISFEDYHNMWSGIATSKETKSAKNPRKYPNSPLRIINILYVKNLFLVLESIQDNPLLQELHYGLSLGDLHSQMKRQLEE